jgi:Ca2+-binding EF-hand superfamily protein
MGHRLSDANVQRLAEKFKQHGVQLDQAFLAFDDNDDGKISPAEFRRGIAAMQMGLPDREVDDMIRHFDSSGSGIIQYRDFGQTFSVSSGGGGAGIGGARMSDANIQRLAEKFKQHGVQLDQAFLAFDDNNDGMISGAEFRRGIIALQMSLPDRDVEDMIRHFDPSGAGRIQYRDFVRTFSASSGISGAGDGVGGGRMSDAIIKRLQHKFREHGVQLDQAFLAFDDNNDGVISPAEFRRGIAAMQMGLPGKDVEDMIRHFDSNGSGRISYRDFVQTFSSSTGAGAGGGSVGLGRGGRMSDVNLKRLQQKFREHGVRLDQAPPTHPPTTCPTPPRIQAMLRVTDANVGRPS